MNEEIDLICSQ